MCAVEDKQCPEGYGCRLNLFCAKECALNWDCNDHFENEFVHCWEDGFCGPQCTTDVGWDCLPRGSCIDGFCGVVPPPCSQDEGCVDEGECSDGGICVYEIQTSVELQKNTEHQYRP
eukprot:UN03038